MYLKSQSTDVPLLLCSENFVQLVHLLIREYNIFRKSPIVSTYEKRTIEMILIKCRASVIFITAQEIITEKTHDYQMKKSVRTCK